MSPIRLLVLALLVYFGYLLIRGQKKSDSGKFTKRSTKGFGRENDVLVEDPVCGKMLPKTQAHCREWQGKTYYFCSEECSRKFASEKGDDV